MNDWLLDFESSLLAYLYEWLMNWLIDLMINWWIDLEPSFFAYFLNCLEIIEPEPGLSLVTPVGLLILPPDPIIQLFQRENQRYLIFYKKKSFKDTFLNFLSTKFKKIKISQDFCVYVFFINWIQISKKFVKSRPKFFSMFLKTPIQHMLYAK